MRRGWTIVMRRALAAVAAGLAGAAIPAPAAVDANRASLAQLETVSGLGPDLAEAILAERSRSPFTDWADLVRRVRGIGSASAARLSAGGLRIDGQAYSGAGRRTSAVGTGTAP